MRRSTSEGIVQAKKAVQKARVEIVSVGIDISKERFSVALCYLVGTDGASYISSDFANTSHGIQAFLNLLKKHQATTAPLCMEATGRYWEALAYALNAAGHKVSVVNPARLKAYVKASGWRTKTDKADAQYIAHFCAKQTPDEWHPPTPERRELQSLTRHLEDLKQDRTRCCNRLKANPPSADVRNSIEETIQHLDKQIARLEKTIQERSRECVEFAKPAELLISIPGIAETTAFRLLAELPDVANFPSVRQFAAYAGLNPAIRQSGKSNTRSTLSKQGNKHIRSALFFPAMAAMRCNAPIQALSQRLQEKGKAKMQCLAAAMRKLLHIVYGVLKSKKPYNAQLAMASNLT